MTRDEQNVFLNREYAEAVRYMDNAKEVLQKVAKEDDGYYKDKKYVKSACGIAYLGVLVALDAWFEMKGVANPKKNSRKSVDFYKRNIYSLDRKMSNRFDTVYDTLHLFGYYDGRTDVVMIKRGFDVAREIIEKIRPEHLVEVRESRADGLKRRFNTLLISLAVTFG